MGQEHPFVLGEQRAQGDGTEALLVLTWALVTSLRGGESPSVHYPAFGSPHLSRRHHF